MTQLAYALALTVTAIVLVGIIAIGVLISPWASLAMLGAYILGALARDLDRASRGLQ